MSGIWKINMVQNFTTKDDFNKLSFKKGDSFVARVLKLDGNTSEVIVRLLDGRTFPAKIEGFINGPLDNYLMKFLVQSAEDGKINIKVLDRQLQDESPLSDQNKGNELKDILEKINFSIEKEDIGIIKDMLKSNIPVNEENFTEIKSLRDFITKINSQPGEEQAFIEKYLNTKGIDGNSEKGSFISETLKKFFSEAKKIDFNTILVMKENKIPFTEENIKSFNKVTKADFDVFKEIDEFSSMIKDIESGKVKNNNRINNSNDHVNNKSIDGDIDNKFNKELVDSYKVQSKDISNEPKNSSLRTFGELINEKIINKESLSIKQLDNLAGEEESSPLKKPIEIKDNRITVENGNIKKESSTQNLSVETTSQGLSSEEKLIELKKAHDSFGVKNGVSTEALVKEEFKEKIGLLKSTLSEMLKFTEDNNNVVNKVFQNIESKLQDFKMFNTLNNDYYYLNVPMNVRDDEYDCKLIIKDERSSGKKLDSKNIKIATSISTINMNTVDAYITVVNNNTSIKIESEEKYVKILEMLKHNLLKELENNQYVFNISVDRKKEEFSLVNCREFFDDKDFSTINTKV
ncbi:hypothetical protein [Clostridium sp.]|uniref:hypothetical protein n=1 Tax=Clostridium sp. TaxID=1506 RepID=UPI002FC76A58